MRRTTAFAALLVISVVILGLMAFAGAGMFSSVPASAGSTTTNDDVSGIYSDIDAIVASSESTAALSSNPFDYVRESPALDRLVAKGTPALAAIENRISNSPDNGLEEYLLMIAATRISKIDLDNGPSDSPMKSVSQGKQWPSAWHSYVRAVPRYVAAEMNSQEPLAEKNRRLAALGTPALPLLLDKIARGQSEFTPAADRLLKGCAEVNGATNVHVTPEWARANTGKFGELRNMAAQQ